MCMRLMKCMTQVMFGCTGFTDFIIHIVLYLYTFFYTLPDLYVVIFYF